MEEEATVNESIIVGLVVGGGVAVVGALVSYYLRRWEMKELWAEKERRRKSDRRRELHERELNIVRDSVDAVVEVQSKVTGLASVGEEKGWERHTKLVASAGLTVDRARVIVISSGDEELKNKYADLLVAFGNWGKLLDFNTGEPIKGKEKESEELAEKTESAASDVRRRTRQILEEV